MFWNRKKQNEQLTFDRENEIPVIRSSICTGEQVTGFKNKKTGAFREIACLRSPADREQFLSQFHISAEEIRKEY